MNFCKMKQGVFSWMSGMAMQCMFVFLFLVAMLGSVHLSAAKLEGAVIAETARADSAFRILPRRVAHVRIARSDGTSCQLQFAYDEQGRVVSMRKKAGSPADGGASDARVRDVAIVYTPDRVTAAGAGHRVVCGLTDGRAVTIVEAWDETMEFSGESAGTYTYDRHGYLAGSTFENENVEYAESYAMVDGAFVGMRRDVEGQVLLAECENDPEQLNNLNIDLFGLDEFLFYGNFSSVLLYGIGGRRVHTLPAKIVYRWMESTDAPEYRTYEYEMAGEYIAAVEVCDERGGWTRLDFSYEQ